MHRLSYDLHIHSCLSPCGDDDMTPGNIIGMAMVKGLDVVALTDHNTCKNCPPFIRCAEKYGITAIPGMELCTMEEVHVVCLFQTLEDAMNFDRYVYGKLVPFPNKEKIFGKQQICNEDDVVIGTEENLLLNATTISFDEVHDLVSRYNGIMIPAHIDKNSNSMLSNLGFIPPEAKFTCVELKDINKFDQLKSKNPYLINCKVITNSDAHYLEHINEPVNYLAVKSKNIKDILDALTRV